MTRLLPPDEWPRLEATNAAGLWPHLDAGRDRVIVVEDDGAIIGSVLLLRLLHAECLWIDPAHRGKAGVGRQLLTAIRGEAEYDGVPTVWAAALSEEMNALLQRIAQPLPGSHYVMSMRGDEPCRQQ